MASKSIALALAGIFMMTPLFNMASAMKKGIYWKLPGDGY